MVEVERERESAMDVEMMMSRTYSSISCARKVG